MTRRCLEQIRAQSYPHDRLELIVADGQSTDGMAELIENYSLNGIAARVIRVEANEFIRAIPPEKGVARCLLGSRVDVRRMHLVEAFDDNQ